MNPLFFIDPWGLCADSDYSAFRQRHWYDSVTTYAWITGRNVVNYVGAPYVNTYHAAESYYEDPTLIGACELAQAYLPVVIAAGLQAQFSGLTQKQILNAERVGSALKSDASHRAASFVGEKALRRGKVFSIKGGDGVSRKLLQTRGGLNGKHGIYVRFFWKSYTSTFY
jgi:hypothetical protein